MIVQTNVPSKNWGLLLPRTTLTPKACGLLLTETTEDSSARYFPLSRTIGAEYVSLFATSRTMADSLGRCFLLSRTMRDQYVFHFTMSNRLLDRYPCRAQKHTPLARLSSTLSPLPGRLVGRMQYAPTLSKKEEVSSGRCFPLSRTMADQYVFLFSISNRLSDRCPCRGVLHTPLRVYRLPIRPLRGVWWGVCFCAPTLSEKDEVSSGRYFLLSGTMADKSVFLFFMSNRLSDRCPCRGAKEYAPCTSIVYPFAPCGAFGRAYAFASLHCRKKKRFPRVCVFYCLGQWRINTYFIPSYLIGYQIDTRVGAYCIRPI